MTRPQTENTSGDPVGTPPVEPSARGAVAAPRRGEERRKYWGLRFSRHVTQEARVVAAMIGLAAVIGLGAVALA